MSALRPATRVPTATSFSPAWANAIVTWLERLVHEFHGDLEVGGKLITESGRIENVRLVTSLPDTARIDDEVIDISDTAGGTETLPASANLVMGQRIHIQDSGGNAGTNAITIAADGSDTINGGASVQITTNYGSRTCRWNGSEWIA